MLDQPTGLMFDILTPGEGRKRALDIGRPPRVMRATRTHKTNQRCLREDLMSKGRLRALWAVAVAAVACLGPGGLRPGPGQEDQDRRRLRPDRPVRRRRLGAAVHRRQDHARLLHQAGRRRGLQDRGDLRRRPEQARRRHQRGGAADRAGKGRHAAGLLLLGAVRAGGRPGRAAQEVHVDHHLHLLGGAGEPPPELRLPRRSRAASSSA